MGAAHRAGRAADRGTDSGALPVMARDCRSTTSANQATDRRAVPLAIRNPGQVGRQ
jgi:hypothetical protein